MCRRLLVAHFLRRFLDNDLISPDADRHEAIAVTLAALLSSGLVLTVLNSTKYLFRPLQSPAWTVVVSLDDTFLFSGLSMAVMALVALATWDALSLDARDTAILGPLPIPRRTVVTAQVSAVMLFAVGFAIASNVIPSVLAPLIRTSRLPVGLPGMLTLIGCHAAVTMTAGLFGFTVVLGVREVMRAVLGSTLFERVSPLAQALLVVVCATFFLLLPGLSADVDRRWLEPNRVAAMPPLWFVGLHETLTGNSLAGLPPTEPPADAPAHDRIVAYETRTMARYRTRGPLLAALGRVAVTALAMVLAVSAAACAWNGRRLPAPTSFRPRRTGRLLAAAGGVLLSVLARRPLTRAGFVFTLHTLGRSVPHRVALATALGVAVAAAAACLLWVDTGSASDSPPLGVMATQTVVLAALVAGFRRAARVPADLRGHATFVLTTSSGDDRPFVTGVVRAGVVAIGVPAIACLAPVHIALMGTRLAAAHALAGMILVLLMMELAFRRTRGLPFVSLYEPAGNVMALGPIYLLVAFAVVWTLAWVERYALASLEGTIAHLAALTAGWALAIAIDRRETAGAWRLEAHDVSAGVTGLLVLHE